MILLHHSPAFFDAITFFTNDFREKDVILQVCFSDKTLNVIVGLKMKFTKVEVNKH
jgi:hypothetical protein